MYNMFKSLVEGTGQHLIWGGGRSFYDGVSGKTKWNGVSRWKDKEGNSVKLNPLQKTARRIKANQHELWTGQKMNPNTMQSAGKGSRLSAAGEAAIGTLTAPIYGGVYGGAMMAGWGIRTAGGVGLAASKPLTRATGHLAYQGAAYTADTAIGAAKTIHKLNQSAGGRNLLFYGGGAGALAVGLTGGDGANLAANGITKSGLSPEKIAPYEGGSIESVPGTLASQGAGQGSRALVNTGADGDLVLAMHTLR